LTLLRAGKRNIMIDSASLRPLQPALSLVEWVEGRYASNTEHDPELLKWENWKDKES